MNYHHIALSAALIGTAMATSSTVSAGEPRAVIELFTSQGCSSCPAADKVLGELSRDPSLVTLSLPVDYWDYLGWKDTLALHGHSNRERAYADARGDREVYTPQAVIDGVVHVLGSDKAAIEGAVARTRHGASPLTVPVSVTVAEGRVQVNVPAATNAQGTAEVWLCPVTGKAQVVIKRGENNGRTLTYYNVVRRWVKLGEWTGKAESYNVPLASLPDANYSLKDIDHVAVLLQRGPASKPGLMLGAATAPVTPGNF
jgi:hypothetical protein